MKVPQIVIDLGDQDWGACWNDEPLKVQSVILLYRRGQGDPVGAEVTFQNESQLTHLTWFDGSDGIDAWNGQQRMAMHDRMLGAGVSRYECFSASCARGFYFSHKDRM